MVVPPFIDQREELVEAVTPLLEQLVTAPGVLDLETTTEQIGEVSRTILSPEETEETEETESPEPTESPSE
jgi:multiple sugar transport system substrate-binding protein